MLHGNTKTELREIVKRRLGAPMVKLEICDDQINDFIDYSTSNFIKWAVGNATDIIWFTIPLKAGRKFYDLPKGVIDILGYEESNVGEGGINTLFTIENYLYNQGYFDSLFSMPYSVIDFHIVNDWMETLDRYQPDKYSWRFHKITNQLEITPTPKYGNDNIIIKRPNPNTNIITDYQLDSPGYIMIKANVIQGSTLPNIIRGWEDVCKEILPSDELRIIRTEEANINYFALTNNAINQEMTIIKNGSEYNKWKWLDDNGKSIEWTSPNDIIQGDELLLKYNTIKIEENLIDDNANIKTYNQIINNYIITVIELTTKTLLLSEKTLSPENIIIKRNGNSYFYGNDFLVDNDDQTINFAGKTLDGILQDQDSLEIIFTSLNSTLEEYKEDLYGRHWIIDMTVAMTKQTLGLIRRKFSQFQSIGNSGISLDGESLISEAREEIDKLNEELRDEEVYEGGYIIMG